MTPDRTLRQYLAGALEPPATERVEAQLASSPTTRARLELLRATTVAEPAAGWTVPPPGVQTPWSLVGTASLGAVMGLDGPVWVTLRFEVPPEAADHLVLVLERPAERWTALFPSEAAEEVRAAELPVTDGSARLDVAIDGDGDGARRLGVVLVPPAVGPDWTAADPWVAVREALEAGRVPVVGFVVG